MSRFLHVLQRVFIVSRSSALGLLLSTVLPATLYGSEKMPLKAFMGVPSNGYSEKTVGFVPQGEETFIEQWQFLAQLSDGSLLQTFFVIHNLGIGDEKPVVLVKYVKVDGSVYTAEEYPKVFSADADKLGLRFGQNFITREGSDYNLNIAVENISFKMTVSSLIPPYTPGDGLIQIAGREDRMLWSIPIPRGHARGTLKVAGDERAISALVYGDHTQGTLPANEFSYRWLSARLHGPEYSVDFLAVYTNQEFTPPLIALAIVAQDGHVVRATKDCLIEGDLPGAKERVGKISAMWSFECKDGRTRIQAKLDTQSLVHRSTSFRMLRGPSRIVAKLLAGRPIGQTFTQTHQVDLMIDDDRLSFSGNSYSEMLTLLKK